LVILLVLIDIVIFFVAMYRGADWAWHNWAQGYSSPWLLFGAAVFPAAVASFSGIQFQSECMRLANRSAMTKLILGARQKKARLCSMTSTTLASAPNNPGAWTLEAIELAESCARITTDEVADWSVLYAKSNGSADAG
jgi:hypothetical protein